MVNAGGAVNVTLTATLALLHKLVLPNIVFGRRLTVPLAVVTAHSTAPLTLSVSS